MGNWYHTKKTLTFLTRRSREGKLRVAGMKRKTETIVLTTDHWTDVKKINTVELQSGRGKESVRMQQIFLMTNQPK